MRRLVLFIPILLAGCGEPEPSAAERAAQDEADIAAVKDAQVVRPTPVAPDPIRYPDIERHQLYGAACAFVPEGGGLAPVALAMERAGYMKIDGEIERFAPDPGSAQLPLNARGKYDGRDFSFLLDIAEGEGRRSGSETISYDARLILRNGQDQVLYEASGLAQCGS